MPGHHLEPYAAALSLRLFEAIIAGGDAGLQAIKAARQVTSPDVWAFCMTGICYGPAGATLCHIAAGRGEWHIYKYLCCSGANPHMLDGYSLLPSQVAHDCGHVAAACAMRLFYEISA